MNTQTELQAHPTLEGEHTGEGWRQPRRTWSSHTALLVILALGLLVRLVLLYMTMDTGLMIVDEQHYHTLALNLAHGHGFAKEPGVLTSIRPPLYPFFIAVIWLVTGTESLLSVKIAQILLSLANVFVLYRLGLLLFNRRIALLAAAGFCFYPSLVGFNFLLLTEVLFILLLTLVVLYYVKLVKTGKSTVAWGLGVILGVAALTRSILWPFPVVLGPLLLFCTPGNFQKRLKTVLLLCLGYALVITPWAIRNTRLQGVLTVVDTMGGLTLRMGNYEHTPLNRAWDPVTLRGETSIFQDLYREHSDVAMWTEGRKEKWAMKKALTYMLANPLITFKRTLIKFASFWGLERSLIAGWQQGLYQPLYWLAALGTLAITSSYIVLMMLASLGFSLERPEDRRVRLFLVLLIFFITGIHSVIFGHARYHLPLIPILFLYAAAAWVERDWLRLRQGGLSAAAPLMTWCGLLIIWGREILVVEADRIQELLRLFFP